MFAGQYDSDTPTGFTDEDDDEHRKGFTKPGPVTAELLTAEKVAKNTSSLRLQNLEERRRRGEHVTYSFVTLLACSAFVTHT